MAILGSTLLEQGYQYVKDKDVSVGAIVISLLILFGAYTVADQRFIPRAEAEENVQTLKEKVDELDGKIDNHVKEYRIKTALQEIEKVETELVQLQLFESIGGDHANIDARKEVLEDRLRHAQEYRNCVMTNGPNCEHLARIR